MKNKKKKKTKNGAGNVMKISGCRITFFNSWTIFWESPYARARRSVDQEIKLVWPMF